MYFLKNQILKKRLLTCVWRMWSPIFVKSWFHFELIDPMGVKLTMLFHIRKDTGPKACEFSA